MSETIRTFIAITLNPDIREALKKIQSDLRKTGADVKWVKPENIHLTLKFLGDTPVEKLPEIIKILQSAAHNTPSFPCSLTHLNAFPKPEHPQIVWIGIEQGKDEVTRLAQTLEDHLKRLGFPKEKKGFDAHVTLGRVRSGLNRFTLSKEIKQYRLGQELQQNVDYLIFYKSTLTSQGPIHEVIETVGFNACRAKPTS